MSLNWEFLASVLQIVAIDVVLSGDNAVVIAMAAHRLPLRQRRMAILFGAAAAIALRVLCTWVLSQLLVVPFLRLVGGLVLVWIAIKLLLEEEGDDHTVREAANLFHAVWIIIMADFVMSLDNMLAVGGASEGNAALIFFGLILSIAIIMTGSAIITEWMNRFPILVVLGAAVLAWTAAEMIVEDEKVAEILVTRPQICIDAGWHRTFGDIAKDSSSKSWFHGWHGERKQKEPKSWWVASEESLVHRHWIGWAVSGGTVLLVITFPKLWSMLAGRRRAESASVAARPEPVPGLPDVPPAEPSSPGQSST